MNLRRGNKKNRGLSLSNTFDNCISDGETDTMTQLSAAMKKQFNDQRKNIKELLESQQFLSDQFEKFTTEIKKLTADNQAFKKQIQQLKDKEVQLSKRVLQLENLSLKSKQKNNENDMIITNLPKIDERADLNNIITEIARQVNHVLQQDEIIEIYQNNNKKHNTHPVIVKLKTSDFKRKCMEYRRKKNCIDLSAFDGNLDNEGKNVNFHNLLDKDFAQLFNRAKDEAKKRKFKYVWINNSTILMRKSDDTTVFSINCIEDFKQIK